MEKTNKILFADDDKEIREVVKILLESEGYDVIEANDGKMALDIVDDDVDLIILDVMMPNMSGYSACTEIRKKTKVPILFLTAKSQESDKTMGFCVGGDDYLVKPFSYSELINRVKAMIRRYCVYGAKIAEKSKRVKCGDIYIDCDAGTVKKNNEEILLTDIEFRILLLLASNKQRIFSMQAIYESIWDEPYFYSANNTVMTHIGNLRRKINDSNQNNDIIKTVWGKGYRIE